MLSDFLHRARVSKTLKPYRRSAARRSAPVESGQLVELTYDTFAEVALNQSFDVLVLFRAPHCSSCRPLLSAMEQLARKYKNVSNLLIAHYDTSANDPIEGYKLLGTPTLLFATRTAKAAPLRFEGGTALKEVDKFVIKHATVALQARATGDNSSSARTASPAHHDDL